MSLSRLKEIQEGEKKPLSLVYNKNKTAKNISLQKNFAFPFLHTASGI